MKRTYTINIAGSGFVIDEDAYEMLQSYLSTLNEICGKAGQQETAADIEQRIAEIFMEGFVSTGPQILSLKMIEEVIGRMGAPEVIMEGEAVSEAPASPGSVPPPFPFTEIPLKKRLYRDTSHKVIGGVCYGLGWYLGIDPVWIRIIMVVLAFASASIMVLVYIILWIAIPAAKTPYERMQMMGMNRTFSDVGKAVTGCAPWSKNPMGS